MRVGPRCTYPRNGSPAYHLALFPLKGPGVAGSSPITWITSLVIQTLLLFLFDRTHNYPVDDHFCPSGSVVWAMPKFVRPHCWGYWIIVRFLGFWSPKGMWNPPPPMTKALVCPKKKKRRTRTRSDCAREVEDPQKPFCIALLQVSVQNYWESQ